MGKVRFAVIVSVFIGSVACKDEAAEQAKIQAAVAVAQAQASASAAIAQANAAQAAASAALAQEQVTQAALAAQQDRVTARQEKRDAEKAAIASSPGKYLVATDVRSFDKGIINHYARLVSISVTNRSHFAVTDIAGEVSWLDQSGGSFGSTPFALTGSIPAGDTKVFNASDGTLSSPGTVQGEATGGAPTFNHATVIE